MYHPSDWQNSWSLYTFPPSNSFLAAPPLWLRDPHNPTGTLSPPLKYYLAADYWAEFDLWASSFLPNEIQVEESSNLQPATIDPRLLHISAPTPTCGKSEKFHDIQTSPPKDPNHGSSSVVEVVNLSSSYPKNTTRVKRKNIQHRENPFLMHSDCNDGRLQCRCCGRSYKREWEWRRAHNNKEYPCTLCGHIFRRRDLLKKHTRTQHIRDC